MCGIAGAINSSFSYSKVTDTLGHRGPDEQDSYRHNNVDLFHLRLSILDISGGHQPMHLGEKYTIIFNGEIYNHAELRKQHNLKGKTSSDTETLLLLYEKFGTEFLDLLDGMFAFVIYDRTKNNLFIARDRAGKKPLYYFNNQKKFVFASELNCLKSMVPVEIEPDHFLQYLRLGTFYRQNTPYKNVTELTGGSFLIVDCDSLSVSKKRWWNINNFYLKRSEDSLEESLQKTDDFLHTAVRRRLESSDLEVGSFLSGGIDSGIVVAIAKQYQPSIKTFTVSFKGEYDEAPLAKLVALKYNTHHTEISISFENLNNDIEKILSNYGEPFYDSSAIPSYYVSREAKRYVTVILNGDGADELFGGYRRYVPFSKYDFFKKNFIIQKAAEILKRSLPIPDEKKSTYNYLYRLAALASKSDLEIYLSTIVNIFEDYENYILDDNRDYLAPIRKDFQKIVGTNLSGLQKIMNLDFDIELFDDFLVKMDIATMANSQEGRSPYLAKELLEYVPSLPDNYKINGKTTKYLLRQLASKYLPAELINQPKRGFEVPLKNWLEKELKEIVFDYLSDSNSFYKNFVKPGFVENLLKHKTRISEEKRAKMLWTLFSMEVWYKKVYHDN
jgi:asparagine synthase (glutamine-hydrolysing)